MAPMQEVREEARKVLEAGDPAGALKILQDKADKLAAQDRYEYMAMWALLDDQVPCLEALGDQEAIKRVRAEQTQIVLEHDSKIATGEIRARHPVTDAKKDLPSRDRQPPPKTEDYRRD